MTQESGREFRHAAGRFASGVTVVTTRAAEGAYGTTVSSFASLSLNPLLVTVSINRSSSLLGYIRTAGAFAISVLASDQQQVAEYFAMQGRTPQPGGFPTVPTMIRQTGAPIIDGCLSWFDCTVEDLLPGGDHEILVGRVAAAGGRTGEPLVYWAGGYRALTAAAAQSDRLANAADGLAVTYHFLDVGPEELLDAQNSVEPAMAAFAARRAPAEDWDRLEEMVDQSEQVIELPDEFNQLALAFHNAIAEASRNRVLQATLASLGEVLSIHYRDRGSPESARAAVEAHRQLLAVLRSGDAEAAREEMYRHLLAVRGHLQIG